MIQIQQQQVHTRFSIANIYTTALESQTMQQRRMLMSIQPDFPPPLERLTLAIIWFHVLELHLCLIVIQIVTAIIAVPVFQTATQQVQDILDRQILS